MKLAPQIPIGCDFSSPHDLYSSRQRGPLRDTGFMSVRVGILEDDPLLRSTLSRALEQDADFEVSVSTERAAKFLEAVGSAAIDVALLDVHLGAGPTGFDVARRARALHPRIGLVFLSSVRDPRLLGYQSGALPQGSKYLLKSQVAEVEQLQDTLREVASNTLSKQKATPPRAPLSKGQLEILRLVAEGLNNSEIAKRRVVSERAVEMAVSRLAEHLGLKHKPGVNQRVHIAARFFQEMGWTP